jgi:hypothetical protein
VSSSKLPGRLAKVVHRFAHKIDGRLGQGSYPPIESPSPSVRQPTDRGVGVRGLLDRR